MTKKELKLYLQDKDDQAEVLIVICDNHGTYTAAIKQINIGANNTILVRPSTSNWFELSLSEIQ